MSNPNKRKGSMWEQTVVDYLKSHGFSYAERRVQGGSKDRGDIGGVPGVVLECKAVKTFALGEWMEELRVEKKNAGVNHGVVVVKRRAHTVDKAFVVLELEDYVHLLGD